MKMTFGYAKGFDIVYLRSSYLIWLNDEIWFWEKHEKLAVAIKEELKYRDLNQCHFKEDKINV